jgi:hypothetical protein
LLNINPGLSKVIFANRIKLRLEHKNRLKKIWFLFYYIHVCPFPGVSKFFIIGGTS